jgi:hypothetical protein
MKYLVEKYEAGYWLITDPLQPEELSSLRNYRAALHREYIRRCPGKHSRVALGSRLGVSKSATAFYETDGIVKKRPRHSRTPLNIYANPLDLVPTVRESWATWLEIEKYDDREERWCGEPFRAPPRKIIAARWLSRGARVSLVTQQMNEYWVD